MGLERFTFFWKVHLSFFFSPKKWVFCHFFFEKLAKNKYICDAIVAKKLNEIDMQEVQMSDICFAFVRNFQTKMLASSHYDESKIKPTVDIPHVNR